MTCRDCEWWQPRPALIALAGFCAVEETVRLHWASSTCTEGAEARSRHAEVVSKGVGRGGR